jgi:hypothetical protein
MEKHGRGGARAAARQQRRGRTRSDSGAWRLRTEASEAVAVGQERVRRLSGRWWRGRGGREMSGAGGAVAVRRARASEATVGTRGALSRQRL